MRSRVSDEYFFVLCFVNTQIELVQVVVVFLMAFHANWSSKDLITNSPFGAGIEGKQKRCHESCKFCYV